LSAVTCDGVASVWAASETSNGKAAVAGIVDIGIAMAQAFFGTPPSAARWIAARTRL
jgi:hypothetical protein